MPLYRITLRLGRNPSAGFAEGDDSRGYVIVAPLNSEGKLDAAEWSKTWRQCTVRHFSPDLEQPEEGRLRHKGERWFFDYDPDDDSDDEPVYKLGDHRLKHGDYVTIHEAGGEDLVYVVTEEQLLPGQGG